MLKRQFSASTLLLLSLLALVLLATPPSVRAELAVVPPDNVSPAIMRTCQRITDQSLLRIQGDFGHFQGYVSQAGPGGLDGLRAHPADASAVQDGAHW